MQGLDTLPNEGQRVIVWHVTTLKKLNRYASAGRIMPPVRAWENLAQAERFSLSTARRVILRLKFNVRQWRNRNDDYAC